MEREVLCILRSSYSRPQDWRVLERYLYGILRRRCYGGCLPLMEDCVQEALLRVFKYRRRIASSEYPLGYLSRIASTVCSDVSKRYTEGWKYGLRPMRLQEKIRIKEGNEEIEIELLDPNSLNFLEVFSGKELIELLLKMYESARRITMKRQLLVVLWIDVFGYTPSELSTDQSYLSLYQGKSTQSKTIQDQIRKDHQRGLELLRRAVTTHT